MHYQIRSGPAALLARAAIVAVGLGGGFANGAADNAADPAYAAEAGGAWKGWYDVPDPEQNPPGTDNGGTGFGVWDFSGGYHLSSLSPYGRTNHFIDGVDFPHSTYNNLGGPAFALTNFNGDFATSIAKRPFAVPMSVGDVFSVKFDSPATYDTAGYPYYVYPFVIIEFSDGAGQKTFNIEAGKNELYGEFPWRYDDATGDDIETGIDPDATSDGSALSFQLTSATTGTLTFDLGGPDQQVIPIALKNGAPAAVSFTSYSCNTSDLTGEYEFFFNDLAITRTNEWQKANGSNDGNWGDAAQWKSGAVPDAIDAVANFASHASVDGNVTVTVDAPRHVGTINFDNPTYSYRLVGTSAITLDVSSGEARINVISGSHAIDVPLTLADDTTVTVAPASANLTLSNIQASSAKLTKAGAGTLRLTGVGAYAGGTVVAAGTLVAANADALGGGAVAVADGALARAQADLPKAVTLSTLTTNATGKFDLTDNSMVLRNMAIDQVRSLIQGAYNAGHWNGATGLDSSTAAANASGTTAIGYATAGFLGKSTFKGVSPLNTTDVLVKYTYYGDNDLSGFTTLDDFTLFLVGLQNGGTTWVQGDYDYSGLTTLDDFNLFIKGYQQQGASPSELEALINNVPMSEAERAAMLAAVDAVPEPGLLSSILVAASAAALGVRRRRRATPGRPRLFTRTTRV
jgi:autotransporter-associated beta strand protein